MAQRNCSITLKPGKSRAALTIAHPNAAGIDIGGASRFVAVPPYRDDEPAREFPSFTVDLNALADWHKACGVGTVAMESTRRVPDPPVLTAGIARLHRTAGQRTSRQEGLGAQVRCTGIPVAAITHDLRTAQRGVPPGRASVRIALAVAPVRDGVAQPGSACAARAKGTHSDEHPAHQRLADVRPGDRAIVATPAGSRRCIRQAQYARSGPQRAEV